MQNTAQYEILLSKDLDVQLGVIIEQHLKTSAPAIYDQGRLFSLHA
jgi:NAD(P)H-nitrite reductase large subunit